jgi:hypothetical protein
METEHFTEINDIRLNKDFKGITFSNFKKSEVCKQLLTSLIDQEIEQSNYWACELITSGHFLPLWDLIIFFYSKYIQISNPKLAIYLDLRFHKFKEIINFGYKDRELDLRNNIKIRKLFAEIISILCLSKRNHIFQEIKIKSFDLDLTNIINKLKAPNIDFIQSFYKDKDPKSLFIQFNEFIYNLEIKNCIETCYWFEYILNFEISLIKKKEKHICFAERRVFKNIEPKYQNDIIWIFWEILFQYSKKNKLLEKIVHSCFQLFSIKYYQQIKYKRKFIIYFVITLITGNIQQNTEIILNKECLSFVLNNIDKIYSQIKQNEISPNTDYLFSNIKKSKNFEKTINQLNKMNSIEETFIPRENIFENDIV